MIRKWIILFLCGWFLLLWHSGAAFAEIGTAVRIRTDVAWGSALLDLRFTRLAQTYPNGGIARVEIDPGVSCSSA